MIFTTCCGALRNSCAAHACRLRTNCLAPRLSCSMGRWHLEQKGLQTFRTSLRHHKRPSPQLVAIIPCFKAGAADCQRGWILRNVIECRAIRSQVHLFKHHRRLVPVVPICCGAGRVEKNFPAPWPAVNTEAGRATSGAAIQLSEIG
jgi:hypothetical protein